MKNHLDEKVYTTYNGWKRAVKDKWGNSVIFEGDKDTAQAFVSFALQIRGQGHVGEWDGVEGTMR